MANIQTQFVQFDDRIRLKRFDENQLLRDKRDIILDKLRDKFSALRKEGKDIPKFDPFNQGSYQMGTGIQPADGDYDIDVGLRFQCSKSKYPNPVDLKILVADALKGHTELGTDVRRSCVTVYYKLNGEQAYHVDLAVYTYDDPNSATPRLFLAKGFRDADAQNRWWEESDPMGLSAWVEQRFSTSEEELQFLRVIRALKRWKTEKFKTDGNNAPSGIGLTVAAGQWFVPRVTRDALAKTTTFNDLEAMQAFVLALVGKFQQVGVKPDGSPLYRLNVPVPVAPREDIFKKMSDGQMTTFRERLIQLRDLLARVVKEPDPVEACKMMQKDFCSEFPVPDKSDTGQRMSRAISSGGISA
ncbi:nucleotidyltransferase [Vitiosangium sp. GDMCC 1.1324]|uniref:nucleotidyltransferase domain-containing protein n=1 Tax=Vitiosangium sp. (strain GDMCC 1.1324) TaxID=2138576 RepID=UPI000D331DAC|nr:nucleotidyltransferase [Vitiosangium sp. GDMCC 1.1324]PTL78192.1 nucleotidyltransferase [Vitiosangium sp. GDMCC 1.1324]